MVFDRQFISKRLQGHRSLTLTCTVDTAAGTRAQTLLTTNDWWLDCWQPTPIFGILLCRNLIPLMKGGFLIFLTTNLNYQWSVARNIQLSKRKTGTSWDSSGQFWEDSLGRLPLKSADLRRFALEFGRNSCCFCPRECSCRYSLVAYRGGLVERIDDEPIFWWEFSILDWNSKWLANSGLQDNEFI